MWDGRLIAVIGVLLSVLVALSGSPASPPDVEVRLGVRRPVHLVRWVDGRSDRTGEVALEGALTVHIRNRGEEAVVLRDLENHGLVFHNLATDVEHRVIHPCKCVKDFKEPEKGVFRLEAGQSKTITLDEWGCSSMWKPPPKGPYELRYRVLRAPEAAPPPPDDTEPRDLVARCREELASPGFWRSSAVSNVVPAKLKRPKRKRIPR